MWTWISIGIVWIYLCYARASTQIVLVEELTISKRSVEALPDLLSVRVTMPDSDRSFPLTLTRTRQVQIDKINVVLDEPVLPSLKNRQVNKRTQNIGYYQNTAQKAVLAVINENGEGGDLKRKLYGTLIIDQKTYEITPVSHEAQVLAELIQSRNMQQHNIQLLHSMREVTLPDVNMKADYTKSAKADETGFVQDTSTEESDLDKLARLLQEYEDTEKRGTIQQTVFHIEMNFLVEYSIFEYWMRETGNNAEEALDHIKFFYTHIFHGIYLMYNNIESTSLSIRPWLKSLHVASTLDASSYAILDEQGRIELGETEDNIRNTYMPQNSMDWNNTDHIMLWTKRDLILGGQAGILGLAAQICGICMPGKSITQNHEYGLFSYFTGAHELGHVLGALHDNDDYDVDACKEDKLHLMTPYSIRLLAKSFKNSFTFSQCSVKMFESCIRGENYPKRYSNTISSWNYRPYPRTCAYNNICNHGEPVQSELDEELPGTRYSLDEQCQLGTGDERAVYTEQCQREATPDTGLDVCKQLYCNISGTCTNAGNVEMRAVAGSPCDSTNDNICWMGSCVAKNTFDYTPSRNQNDCSRVVTLSNECEDVLNPSVCTRAMLKRPWECFTNKMYDCSRTCMLWNLYKADDAPCEFRVTYGGSSGNGGNDESGENSSGGGGSENSGGNDNTDTSNENGNGTVVLPQEATTRDSWVFEYCGYQVDEGLLIKCPNDDACIPMWYFGDGAGDCPDKADENKKFLAKLPSGLANYVRCPKRADKLIPEHWMCDGDVDCTKAGRDEQRKYCKKAIPYCDPFYNNTINCPNNPRKCVGIEQLCDGVEDCGKGSEASDEDPYICYLFHTGDNIHCAKDQYQCPQGLLGRPCFYNWEACDGDADCFASSGVSKDEDQAFCDTLPEKQCDSDQFHCHGKSYFCLPDSYTCDGYNDCGDNSDETCGSRIMSHEPGIDNLIRSLTNLVNKRKEQKVKATRKRAKLEQLKEARLREKHIALAAQITSLLDEQALLSDNEGNSGGLMTRSGAISLEILRNVKDEFHNVKESANDIKDEEDQQDNVEIEFES